MATDCSETQYDRALRLTYLRILLSLRCIKSWNRPAPKYSRSGWLFWSSLRSLDSLLQLWLDCVYLFCQCNPFGKWQFCRHWRPREASILYKDVSKSSRTVLVKRSLLTLDVKFLHHLQSTPPLHECSGPSVSATLGSIPGSPFLELYQVPAAIPLESLQWCRIFDPSSEASAWGREGPDRVSMEDGGSLSCCSWPKTAKL